MSILNYHNGTAQLSISDSETHEFTTEIKLNVNTLCSILFSYKEYSKYACTTLVFTTSDCIIKFALDDCSRYVAVIDDTKGQVDLFRISARKFFQDLLYNILLKVNQIFSDDDDFWNIFSDPNTVKLNFIHAINRLKLDLYED